ncbi:unnamed protein product [Ophioblennius macclurei]
MDVDVSAFDHLKHDQECVPASSGPKV